MSRLACDPAVKVAGPLSQARGTGLGGNRVQRVPSGRQQRRDQEDESRRVQLAAASWTTLSLNELAAWVN